MNIDDILPQPKKRKPAKPVIYRKSQAVKELEALYMAWKRKEHPTVPFLSGRAFRDDNANHLTDCVVWWIRLHHGTADRINNVGIYDAKRGIYRKGNTRKGIADVIGAVNGRYIAVEVKFGKDRQSDAQKLIQQEVENAGGVYIIARTFEGFVEDYRRVYGAEVRE